MTSMDQAFVKAFARRNRPSANRVAAPHTAPQATTPEAAPVETPTNPIDEPGSLQVDQSVAGTAQVWVDPIEDSIARADDPATHLRKPHIPQPAGVPPATPAVPDDPAIDVMAQLHTAYATPLTETPVEPAHATSFAPPTLEPPAPSATPAPISEPSNAGETVELRIDPPSPRAPMAHTPFQAVWEVDVFDVPHSVADLFFEGTLFQQIAERMSEAVSTGLNTVLVTSTQSGEGRSSVAIGMAMAAAAAGIRVALVDADTQDPTLADDLRLDLRFGWVDTIRGGLPIKEVAVLAVEDGVTLIPLMPPHGHTSATESEVAQMIELLKYKFELVIIDGPTDACNTLPACASSVDSAIIVRDVTRTDARALSAFSHRLRKAGVQGVGVVENFV